MINLIHKAKETAQLSNDEIVSLLKNDEINDLLFKTADEVRRKYVGDEIHLRALIEFSNICRCNCLYCGLRAENSNIQRYRMSKNEILATVQRAIALGFKTIVLQSGEDLYFSKEKFCEIIREIKKYDVALTLSIGERDYEDYKVFKDAGADRFLLRIETTDKNLYKKMHPDMDWNRRKQCLTDLKSLGYELGCGCLVGLPEQTLETLANDILFFKEICADMIGIGPLITHCQTPLRDVNNGDFTLTLKVMAITRILMRDVNIPATTAMETLHPEGRIIALQCGANVVMPNVADCEIKKKYEIYPNKAGIISSVDDQLVELKEKIYSIGRSVATGKGFRAERNKK